VSLKEERSPMPVYKVRYKTDADPDSRSWFLGTIPDRETAVAIFNVGDARRENLGDFTLDETDPHLPDYNLVEQEVLNGSEIVYPLYKEAD
jgi:hypothetical protein